MVRRAAPVGLCHRLDTGPREGIRQDSRRHRAVYDDARRVRDAPGKHGCRGVARDERERRLQRIDVTDSLTPLEQSGVEVAQANRPDLALVLEVAHLAPRILRRHARLIGPMDLIEVDALDPESPERRLALAPDGCG